MKALTPRCYLRRSGGSRLLVGEGGLFLGRALGNDVIVSDRAASAVHAVVRVAPRGPEVVPLGKNPTLLNGERLEGAALLRHGDLLAVPGEEFHVDLLDPALDGPATCWILIDQEGRQYGLSRSTTRVGGSPDDDVQLDGWPAGALSLFVAQGALIAEIPQGALVNGTRPPSRLNVLEDGDDVTLSMQVGASTLRVISTPWRADDTTDLRVHDYLPTAVHFEFLPRGANLDLEFERGRISLKLTETRASFLGLLLGAGGRQAPGDWYPDDVVTRGVWPGRDNKGRVDVNNLVHRLRALLLEHGVNPFSVIERRDGATRLRLAPGATVVVR